MQDIGQRATAAATGAFIALGAACALLPSLWMWGFTVDDALIPVRYAHHLASGLGYRFDPAGPSTDGVTPLPWSFLLAPLASEDGLRTLFRAKVLGIAAWTFGGGALGARLGASGPRDRVHTALVAAALVVMGLAFPIGAWAASGMETGLATALATIAATRMDRPRQVALWAGLAAALRPEMVVWAFAMASGAAIGGGAPLREREPRGARTEVAVAAAVAIGPFAVCALARTLCFGRPAPLAVLAKPSDLAHGWVYVGAATIVVLTPLLVLAPLALWRTRGVAASIVLAFLAHALAVAGAGGDWMPYARLLVPVAPSLVIAFAELVRSTRVAWSMARLGIAWVLGLMLATRAAPAGRDVYGDRCDLVARARPVLVGARVVAALDIGWVSAATGDGTTIVDLAGLTDPSIALLPGGHTSKRVDVAMLLDRDVDTVVVYSVARVVESRILRSELFLARYETAVRLTVGSRGAYYTIYRRRRA